MTQKHKILVVEDNDFVRMQIAKFLSDAGYDVIESTDGDDAMVRLDKSISMAVVDVRMEPVDGFAFIRSMRGFDINIPVVLVTGDSNPDLLSNAAALRVDTVLMKPVECDRLVSTVQRALRKKVRAS